MTRYQFPDGFFWGAAASGPQTEGVEGKPIVPFGTVGLLNTLSGFISKWGRKRYVKPTPNTKTMWR